MKREESVMVDNFEKSPLTPEERFCMVAVKKGYLTESQLVKALEIQVAENMRVGKHRFVGEILVKEELITRLQIKDVMESLETFE
ncbi:MAG: hypothetical protein ACQEQ7_06805 [Thermodesulfobacteriota bacterium]